MHKLYRTGWGGAMLDTGRFSKNTRWGNSGHSLCKLFQNCTTPPYYSYIQGFSPWQLLWNNKIVNLLSIFIVMTKIIESTILYNVYNVSSQVIVMVTATHVMWKHTRTYLILVAFLFTYLKYKNIPMTCHKYTCMSIKCVHCTLHSTSKK